MAADWARKGVYFTAKSARQTQRRHHVRLSAYIWRCAHPKPPRGRGVCVLGRQNNGYNNYYQGVNGVQSTLFYHKNGNQTLSDGKSYRNAFGYPFRISEGSSGVNLVTAACRFDRQSEYGATLLFEPILFALNDSTWAFLPMVMPLSALLPESNFAMIADTLMLARTGWYAEEGNNNDCAVPTDFWWA